MINYPIEYKNEKHKYKLIKVYDNYALYIDQYGKKECFKPSDFGIKTYNLRVGRY